MLQFCFTFSISFGILYAWRYGVLSIIISIVSSFIASVLGSKLFVEHQDSVFQGIWEIRNTIKFTQTIVYFMTILCVSFMFLFPQNFTFELTADSTMFYKISMSLLIAVGCVGTNLIIIFVWDAIYKDYLRLADELKGSKSKVHRNVLAVIRPELILISTVNVFICDVLKTIEKNRMISFVTVYFIALTIVALVLASQSYTKARILRIASTETIVIQCKTEEVTLENSVYQVAHVLDWKDGSVLQYVSLQEVQCVEVRKNESVVSVWKPEYRENTFQLIKK